MRRIALMVSPLLAAAAVAVVVSASWPGSSDNQPSIVAIFATLDTRPEDIRFAYTPAANHRVRDEMMGGSSAQGRVSRDALAGLEKRDPHGLAIALVWNGDNLTEAARQLRSLPQTPTVRSDRTAIELLTTNNDNVEPVLAELEALRASDDLAVARAARWNYALLLARLDLPFSAAQAFRAIAAEDEAGWAQEARDRADAAEKRGEDARTSWDLAKAAGEALVTTGALAPTELVRRFPGLMRVYFYNAVRTAPSRERVLALAPMAAELDRIGDGPVLADHVRHVASLDFRRRAPLASAYAQLLKISWLTPERVAELIAPTTSSDVVDIVMGAIVQLDVVADHLDAFRRMVKQTGDPWFEIVLAGEEATLDVRNGNWLGAEARLRNARKNCSPAVAYQCLGIVRQLGMLYQDLYRIPEAVAAMREALGTANSLEEWGKYRGLLWNLADVERFHSSTATARAYANEVLLIAPDPLFKRSAYRTLAGAALLDVDGRAARRELEEALHNRTPDLPAANYLTDIARLDPQPGDLVRLQGWLRELRRSATLSAADRVFADEIEGRLLIESDRSAGRALLEGAVAAAGALPHDVIAEKARAGAYSVLVFDAARHGEHARAMTLIAQQLGLPPPGACTVGMVAEDERAVVVVRGTDGRDHAAYEPARRPRAGAPTVSAELAQALEGCGRVQVMAQAALQGQPRVLPPALAWSYATGARQNVSPQGDRPTGVRSLVVTNVTPPAELGLPALLPRVPAPSSATRMLSGPTATPAQVLAAMGDASEILFHTHALVDLGISDASHLVLSPDPDGRYALTAETIRRAELRNRPTIVLAACHSAQGARYQHAPWSLPHAFLTVGARAVFAAGAAIPDLEAWPFFARVLQRVRTGADPAIALRDERVASLALNPSSWVADVMLFE